jgi:hypothetical protein
VDTSATVVLAGCSGAIEAMVFFDRSENNADRSDGTTMPGTTRVSNTLPS